VTPGHLGRRRRLIPVSAPSLHSQLKTSNRFLETEFYEKVESWSFLTSYARYVVKQKNGRRNRYQIQAHLPLPETTVAAADSVGRHIGGLQGSELVGAAHSAFVNAMAMGMRVAAGVALVCAIGAVFALPRRRKPEAAGLTQAASAVLVLAA
jgi:hypothetical protein